MSRERALLRRLQLLDTLGEAVGALRSISALHFRGARAALPAARAYRDEVERMLAVLAAFRPLAPAVPGAPTALLVVGPDLGLCGDFAARLAAEAVAARRARGPGPVYCVGSRLVGPLTRAGLAPAQTHPSPASVGALPRLLLPLASALLDEHRAGRIGGLDLVAARFEGAGRFRPIRVAVLPVAPAPDTPPLEPSAYTRPAHLAAVLVREFVYVALHETLLDGLAAEHGKRLVVAESARSWVDERREAARGRLASLRREATTQEVLEVAAGARLLGRGRSARP